MTDPLFRLMTQSALTGARSSSTGPREKLLALYEKVEKDEDIEYATFGRAHEDGMADGPAERSFDRRY